MIRETRLNFIERNSDLENLENGIASSQERNGVFTVKVDQMAGCSYESSRQVDVLNIKRIDRSLEEQHSGNSHMRTESEAQSDCTEALLKIKIPFGKPFNENSVNPKSSDTNQLVTSSLDLEERVKGRSKALSPSQSLAARVFSWRSMMLLLLHLSFVINIIPKNTAPIAIVCMVRPMSGVGSTNATTSGALVYQQNGGINSEHLWNSTNEKIDEFEFDWDSNTVGLVLSAITFTSWFGPFFASMIRGYLGNKWTLTLVTLGSALTTLLSPLAARIGPSFLVGLRVISGLAVGGNLPIVSDTIVWWIPESERLTATTAAYSGYNVAGVITFFIAGFMCSVPLDNGWPFIFYIFGVVTLLWTLAWHIMSSQKPEDHPWISKEEKLLIIAKRSVGVASKEGTSQKGRQDKPPYRVIMTSLPIIVHFLFTSVHMWTITIIYTYMPVYFSRRLGFTPEETGVLVSCVGIFRMLGAFVWTAIGNMLMTRPGMTTNKNRKISFTAGSIASAMLFLAISFIDSDLRWLAASIMFALMIIHSVYPVLMPILVMDMAPRYAGFISGIGLSIASVVAIPGPLIVAALTPTNAHSEWMTVWLMMAGVMLVTPIIFAVFGQASLLPWAAGDAPTCPPEKTPKEALIGGTPSLATD